MGAMPDTRALLGVDVVASAGNPGYHLDRVWGALSEMLSEALDASGITPDDVVRYEPVGDGALYTFPNDRLGAVVDLSDRLDKLAERHNRWHKPDLRLRVAVELGAVGDGPGYDAPRIRLNRMLAADTFKALVNTCVGANADEKGNSPVNSGLIMSDAAFRSVFGGDYTSLVRQTDFAPLDVVNKEFTDRAWVRVPGVDARTLAEFAEHLEPSIDGNDEETATTYPMRVTNHISGNAEHSLQAGIVTGGVYFGRDRR